MKDVGRTLADQGASAMTNAPLVSHSSRRAKYLNLAASTVLAPLEFVLTRNVDADTSPVCFIVGPPRSGSTLLYELLVTQFHCGYLSNLARSLFRVPVAATWLAQREIRNRKGSFDSRYGELDGKAAPNEGGRIWAYWMPYAAPYFLRQRGLSPAQMRRKMAGICRITGRPMIVKNLILQSDLPLLIKSFPNAIFIHVERNWADNARSLVKAREDKSSTDETGWWSLRPQGWEVYAKADPVTQSCAQVMLSHQDVRRGLEALGDPHRFMHLSYEDLCFDPARALQSIEIFFRQHGIVMERKSDGADLPSLAVRQQPDDEVKRNIDDVFLTIGAEKDSLNMAMT